MTRVMVVPDRTHSAISLAVTAVIALLRLFSYAMAF
jgi:hypothetical protein